MHCAVVDVGLGEVGLDADVESERRRDAGLDVDADAGVAIERVVADAADLPPNCQKTWITVDG